MKLIQPYPQHDSNLTVQHEIRIRCPVPVRFVKYRYPHHAAPSGYDRICDYINAPTVRLSKPIYWLGETLLRPFGIWQARKGGNYEYSRYDFTMEVAVLVDFYHHKKCLYHFVYAEKSFHLMQYLAGRRGHRFIGTVHHPIGQQSLLFRNHDHFRAFDHLITMDLLTIPFWEKVTGKKNVTWIPHGVDTDFFYPIKDMPPCGQPRIVFSGSHERDFDALIQVIESVLSKVPETRFDLIGNNQILNRCAYRYPQVIQHVRLSDESYRDILQKAQVLFLPLKQSTTCNVVLESLACGTPVITTKGGIESYLNPNCAILVEVGNVKGMTDVLLGQIYNPNKWPMSRYAARKTAELFSWKKIAQQHVDLYNSF